MMKITDCYIDYGTKGGIPGSLAYLNQPHLDVRIEGVAIYVEGNRITIRSQSSTEEPDVPQTILIPHVRLDTRLTDTVATTLDEIVRHRNHLLEFKALVHRRLDEMGVPQFEDEDCRIGARLRWVEAEITSLREKVWVMNERVIELEDFIEDQER